MQLIISTVTPLDFSRQVNYSCVRSLSDAADKEVLVKNAKAIIPTFLLHARLFAASLLNVGITVILDNPALAELAGCGQGGSTGDHPAVASCWLGSVLALEIPQAGRAPEDRSWPA